VKRIIAFFLFAFILLISSDNAVFAQEHDYIINDKNLVPAPKAYKLISVIHYLGEETVSLKNPEDLFIDDKGCLYVADTGNNRIIKMNKNGEVLNIFKGPEDKPLSNPQGIYVDDTGAMYIGDTGNSRIVHLASDGTFVEEFLKPESELLDDDFIYNPSKIYISKTGYIYTIKYQSLMAIDSYNRFRGYVGAAEVGFSLKNLLIRMFASEAQKESILKAQPPPFNNFLIDDNGMIYATTQDNKKGQIKKINSIGKNIYPEGFYGEIYIGPNGQIIYPFFIDIAVDKNGIISVVEKNSGKIYQYDQEGNLLAVFGGIGDKKGFFKSPSSIAVDSDGLIYVLDRTLNNIQVFEPTAYIKYIHEAIRMYHEGNYEKAKEIWKKVLEINGNYTLGHKGIAKSLIKEKKWKEAMEEYLIADDKTGYSEAFSKYRHQLFRENFGLVVLGAAILVFVLYFLLRMLYRLSDNIIQEYINKERNV